MSLQGYFLQHYGPRHQGPVRKCFRLGREKARKSQWICTRGARNHRNNDVYMFGLFLMSVRQGGAPQALPLRWRLLPPRPGPEATPCRDAGGGATHLLPRASGAAPQAPPQHRRQRSPTPLLGAAPEAPPPQRNKVVMWQQPADAIEVRRSGFEGRPLPMKHGAHVSSGGCGQ